MNDECKESFLRVPSGHTTLNRRLATFKLVPIVNVNSISININSIYRRFRATKC